MTKVTFPLHAGAVEKNGQAFLFIASTKTGKTTLVTFLAEKGCPYISDDKVLIDTDTLRVCVELAPVHLRPESLSVLHTYGCDITGTDVHIENFRRIVYTPEAAASGDLPVGGLFFIQRSETENSCNRIPRAEAVQLLMQNQLLHDEKNSVGLKCAIRLAEKCRRLTYADMRYVLEILSEVNEYE